MKQLTADLTARLSPAIASSIAHALSNAPANDYFCAICKAQVRSVCISAWAGPAVNYCAIAATPLLHPFSPQSASLRGAGAGNSSFLPGKGLPPIQRIPGSGSVGPPVELAPEADDAGAYCGACAHAKEWDRRLDERIAEVSPAHVKAHVARALAAYDAAASP